MAYSHSSHRYTDTGMPIFTARSTTRRVDAADSLHKTNERIKDLKKLGETLPRRGAEQNAPPTSVEQKQIEARVRNAAKREKDAVKDNSCCEVMAIGGKVGEFVEPLPVNRDDPWQMGFDDAKSGRFDAKTLGKRRDRYFHELADANEYDKGVLEGEKDGHHEEWHRRIMKHRK